MNLGDNINYRIWDQLNYARERCCNRIQKRDWDKANDGIRFLIFDQVSNEIELIIESNINNIIYEFGE